MAFGDIRGTLSGGNNSIPASFPTTAGSISVSVGDLIFVVVGQQTALTVTAMADNLGNTYSAQNAGNDAGAASGRAFYTRVTNAGTLTTCTATCTGSTNDGSICAVAIEGPFITSPIDANPANLTNDTTTPYSCPASGTLAQANEVIIGWIARDGNSALTAGGGFTKRVEQLQSANIGTAISSLTVSATTTQTPTWTGTAPTVDVLGTASFKKDPVTQKSISVTQGQSVSMDQQTGHRVIVSQSQNASGVTEAHFLKLLTADNTGNAQDINIRGVIHYLVGSTFARGVAQDVSGFARAVLNLAAVTGAGLLNVISLTTQFVSGGGGPVSNPKVITVTQGEDVNFTAQADITIGTPFGVGMSQDINALARGDITVADQTSLGQAEDISLFGRATHLRSDIVSVGQAQDVNLFARATIQLFDEIAASIRNVVTVVANFVAGGGGATTQKAINVTQGQLVTLRRSVGKIITILQGQLVTLRDATGHYVTVLQSQSVALRKSVGKLLLATGLGQLVTLRKSVGKLIIVLQGQLVTIRDVTGHQVTVLQSQSISLIKSVGHRILVTMTQVVTVTRVFAKNKIVNVTQGQLVTLFRSVGKLILVLQGQLITLRDSTGHQVTVLQSQSVTLIKAVGHRILLTQTQVVSVIRSFAVSRIINVTQGQLVTLRRSVGKLILVLQGQFVTETDSTGHQVLVQQSQSVTLLKRIGKIIMLTQTQVVTLVRSFAVSRIVSVTQGQLVTLRTSFGKFIFATQSQAVTLIRQTGHIVRVFQSQAVTLVTGAPQTFQKVISVTQAQLVTLIRSTGHRIVATQSQVVTLLKVRQRVAVISVTTGQVITRIVRVSKIIALTLSQSIVVIKSIPKRIIVAPMGQFIRLFTSQFAIHFRTFLVTTGQNITVFTNVFARLKRRFTPGRGAVSAQQPSRRDSVIIEKRPSDVPGVRSKNNFEHD